MDKAAFRSAHLDAHIDAHLERDEEYEPPDVLLSTLLPLLPASGLIAAFVSLGHEPSTFGLRTSLPDRICLPVLAADNTLTWALDTGSLIPGLRGTLCPTGAAVDLADVSVMVVPAVAVTASGERLGRGGGSYDRAIAALREVRPDALVVAWVTDADVVESLPTEPHDARVDFLATESGVYRC